MTKTITPPLGSGPDGQYVSIASFGAVADGTTNNQAAIQATLDYAAAHDLAVYIPPGNFAYSGTLTANGIAVFGAGASSVLTALTPSAEALIITGSGGSVSDLAMDGATSGRLSIPQAEMIWADGASNYTIQNVLIDKSASGGIMSSEEATGGRILDNTIENTNADSITSIHGASGILVEGNRVLNSGDDGISVVSYTDSSIVNNITIVGNTVLNNLYGRGITDVGGNNVQIVGNNIAGGPAGVAGVYIAAEAQNGGTQGDNNVLVSGNTIMNAGGAPSGTGMGAITIYNSQGTLYALANITITGNQIVNPLSQALQFTGNGYEQATVSSNTVYTNGTALTSNGNADAEVTLSGNTMHPASAYTTPVVPAGGGIGMPAASANGTEITDPLNLPIYDSQGNAWSLVPSANLGLQIAVNGTVDATTSNVKLLETLNGEMVQENILGHWYTEPGPSGPWTQIADPAVVPPDTLTLHLSEDAYQGNAQFIAKVNGTQICAATPVTALHSLRQTENISFQGSWGAGPLTVEVDFINDAYGGSASLDRNLYVSAPTYDGVTAAGGVTALYGNGGAIFTVGHT